MDAISRRWLLPALSACVLSSALAEPAQSASTALALISVEAHDGNIQLIGSALALEASAFSGEMVIDRRGDAGSVSTRQARDFNLAAGEKADIARVGVSYRPGDRLDVTVTLTHNGAIISQTRLSNPEN